MVAYLKAGVQVRTSSDYLRAASEAKKKDSIELLKGPRAQTTNNPLKPRTTSFFPLKNLKGNQPLLKRPAVHLVHLEEEDVGYDEDQERNDPGRIKGVTEKLWFIWQGLLKMPMQMRSTATNVATWNISSSITCL